MTGFELREAFIERFLQTAPVTPPAFKTPDLKKLTGFYWGQRRPFTTLAVFGEAFNPAAVLRVELTKDGRGLLLNGSGPYRDIGGGVFVSPTGRNAWKDPYAIDHFKPPHLAFSFDKNGNVTYLTPGIADQVWARVSPVFNPRTMTLAFLGFGAVAISGLLMFLWPRKDKSRLADGLAAAAVVPVLALPGLMFLGFATGDGIVLHASRGDMPRFWGMIAVANAAAVIAVALAAVCILAWRRAATPGGGWGQLAHKVHLTAVSAAAAGLVVVFWFFNLIGVHLPG